MTMAPGIQPVQPATIDPAILQQLGLAQPPQDSLTLLQHLLPMLPPQMIPYITALMQHPDEFTQMNPTLSPAPTSGLMKPPLGMGTMLPPTQDPSGQMVPVQGSPATGTGVLPPIYQPGQQPGDASINRSDGATGAVSASPDVGASGSRRETIGLNVDPRYNMLQSQDAAAGPAPAGSTTSAGGNPATSGSQAAKAALASPGFNSVVGGNNVAQPGGGTRTEGTTPDQQAALVKAALAPGISYGVGNLAGYDPTTGAPINNPNAPQGHLGGSTPAPANEDPAFQRFRNDYATAVMGNTITADQAATGPKAVGPGGIPIY